MACEPVYYTLVYSGQIIGDQVVSLRSSWSRLTPIQRRQNYWAESIILDGRYPALQWDHDILIYVQDRTMVRSYVNYFYSIPANLVSGSTRDLRITTGSTTVSTGILFGNCYFDVGIQEQPEELLLYSAGFMRLKFIGTRVPTVA